MKQFDIAARRGEAAVPNKADVQFQWGDEVLVAHAPSSGQLALLLSHADRLSTESLRSMFDFLAGILDDADYDVIRNDLATGVDVELVVELIQYLIEEWSARPTTPSAASSPSPRSTGRSSTARQRVTA